MDDYTKWKVIEVMGHIGIYCNNKCIVGYSDPSKEQIKNVHHIVHMHNNWDEVIGVSESIINDEYSDCNGRGCGECVYCKAEQALTKSDQQ